jgi:hypothetical protein
MKLLIRRASEAITRSGQPGEVAFAVSFHLVLLPEEHRWVEQLALFDKWVSSPESCPDGAKCTTPRWTVRDVLNSVRLQPRVLRPADCYSALRQVLHAEADVERGCEFLATALDDAESYQGVRELSYGVESSGAAG